MQEDSYALLCRTHQLDCPLGIPGLSIPIGLGTDSMPVSIMFYARTGALFTAYYLKGASHLHLR